jgi:sec-independent protein translocase protein TatA
MLGVGFPELVLILVVALIVLGPQRLPEVARMLGRAYAQLRRVSEEFQNTIRQDLAALERQEDANRNKAVAQEIRERFAAIADVHTAIIREREEHG